MLNHDHNLASAEGSTRAEPPNDLIAIEGPIGVGKSTLAKRLSELFGARLILEEPERNEFLIDFYRNPKRYALHTQLSFLIRRSRQMAALSQSQLFDKGFISDFSLDKNRIFAQLTLSSAEYQLYEQVQTVMHQDKIQPGLMIYLQASVDTLIDRICGRGIRFELNIDSHYLRRLCEAYINFFHNYSRCPLLIINAENIDFVTNDEILLDLANKIQSIHHGRHYYNPLPQNESLSLT